MQLTIFFINARLELEWHLKIISQRLTFLLFTVFQNGEVQKLYLLFHKVTRLCVFNDLSITYGNSERMVFISRYLILAALCLGSRFQPLHDQALHSQ